MNIMVGTSAEFRLSHIQTRGNLTLRISGMTRYRVFVNGQFVGNGPSRGPHGFHRVDQWSLMGKCIAGINTIAVEVAGYNVNSFYTLDAPSFIAFEIAINGRVLLATGRDPIVMSQRLERTQKVQRYSFQRPFSEIWTLRPDSDSWKTTGIPVSEAGVYIGQPDLRFINAIAPLPKFKKQTPARLVAAGKLTSKIPKRLWKDRSLTQINKQLKGFPESEIPLVVTTEWQSRASVQIQDIAAPYVDDWTSLGRDSFQIIDFGKNISGFVCIRFKSRVAATLHLLFDEILTDGDVDQNRLGCANIVEVNIEAGDVNFETFEPYTLRYLKVAATNGPLEFSDVFVRELACPDADAASFDCADELLKDIFEAARQTYRQNAVDIFMDCPSRERAGWLCDSFWSARTGHLLSGHQKIETAFLENYALPKSFQFIPDGMLPMCYPSDHNDGVFIANWALWFVVQLNEYKSRGGSENLIQSLRPRVEKLFKWFERYQNSIGLLEKVPSWVFVEWSKANDFVQDVNFPSNMLYSGALNAAAELYGNPSWKRQADAIKKAINELSFDGSWYVDNAIRKSDGSLVVTNNRSETCQYYAFFFDIASPKTRPELWRTLSSELGPKRDTKTVHPDIHISNAFIGNYLRIEVLSRAGMTNQILRESTSYFGYMAERTGTLWENTDSSASCNHGFASHVAVMLLRDVVGITKVDHVAKRVYVVPSLSDLTWSSGSVPVPGGLVTVSWKKTDIGFKRTLKAPAGWKVIMTQQKDWN
ncbi:MAG: family 78 glycoside hydrolase catalytic domain [Armatimonadota bacterium]